MLFTLIRRMRYRSNRKAQIVGGYDIGKEVMYNIVDAVVLGVMAILLVVLIFRYTTTVNYFPDEFRQTALIYRFVNSPNCVAYEDPELKRVYPGVMDWDRFKDNSHINKCYSTGDPKAMAFRLTLKNQGELRSVQTSNWDSKREFDISKNRNVLVMGNGKLGGGELAIAIQKNE